MEQPCATRHDRFFSVIDAYRLPMERLERVIDSSYFLRSDLSFAFAQGYFHPPGGFYGKLINYPDPGGGYEIFGRPYTNTTKRRVGGELHLIPIDEQLALNLAADRSLADRAGFPPFAEYHVRFDLAGCVGFFDHRHSLAVAMGRHPWLAEKVARLSEFLGLPAGQLGATGSSAYGKIDQAEEDIDLAIYGSLAEHREVMRRIDEWLRDPANRVHEFGRTWPMRFMIDGTLVCPFFIYGRREEIPLADFTMETVRAGVPFSGRVCDDAHSIYLPVMLGLEEVRLGGGRADDIPLIIYDSSVRGEFRRGDRLEGPAALVEVRRPRDAFRALLVTMGSTLSKRARRPAGG
ncbi:MAG: hypothetical protein PHN82_02425 [bacterium]|nr:hypothetical protein [bacterium]